MMSKTYDAVIIGGGHNGLVTAAYLARARYRVLVLERRETLGGAAATEELAAAPGFKFNTGAPEAGLFRPQIVADLNLKQHGLEFIEGPAVAFSPHAAGAATGLTLWRDESQTVAEIARFSEADAAKFPAFSRLMTRLAGVLEAITELTPPQLTEAGLAELWPWLKVGLKLRRLGKREMMEFLRVLPLSAAEFLDEWFESDVLKGMLGAAGIAGSMQGPRASGTALMLLYHHLNAENAGLRVCRLVRGGSGQLSAALAGAARQFGADVRTGAEVAGVVVKDYQATGVVLADGDEIPARVVISNADPRRTFLGLVGAPNLDVGFVRRVRNIRLRGCTAKVNLALSGLPHFRGLPDPDRRHRNEVPPQLSGRILISPDLDYLERAYDDAKYGRFSSQPYLEVVMPSVLDSTLAPPGQHVMSITMQYAPYHLRDGDWDAEREALGDHIVDTLAGCAPDLKDLILHRQVLTPLDWERDYGLTEGGIYHGQMGLDQLLFMRPVPGFGQYRTPLAGLYLCGAGAHPGGGVTGVPGFNAAREVLRGLEGR